MEFRAASLDWANRVSIIAAEMDRSIGKISHIAKPVTLEMAPHTPYDAITHGTLDLSAQEAVSLMNALWSAGVRPTDYQSPAGEVRRLEAHLADMQRLVFSPPSTRRESS